MDCDDFEKTLKIIVVGNGNVGKTSMTTRYAKGKYTGQYKKTIGVDFMEKQIYLQDLEEVVNMMIWDTAGQEEFDALTSRYYKGAGAVVYVFSTTDRNSFDDLKNWKKKVEEECGKIAQALVQNKIDLIDQAKMENQEVEALARHLNIKLFRSCVADNINVAEVFEYLCRQYIKGGCANSGADAVAAIGSLVRTPSLTDKSKSASNNANNQSALAAPIASERILLEINDDEVEAPKHMSPSKRRTGGKKKRMLHSSECCLA